MNENKINVGRRKTLIAITSIIGGIGAGFASIPFISSWAPSAKAKALGAPVEINVNKMEEGQKITLEWRGSPIFVIKRSKETINNLKLLDNNLRDPYSNIQQQPQYASNIHRSIKEEILVVVGVCTHLGCVPLYKPKKGEIDSSWIGGFFCPCHGSKFDLAGRVFKGVPAPCNLVVPPHSYINEQILRIGD